MNSDITVPWHGLGEPRESGRCGFVPKHRRVRMREEIPHARCEHRGAEEARRPAIMLVQTIHRREGQAQALRDDRARFRRLGFQARDDFGRPVVRRT
jgi:hypothetical protein